jgi:hypothetical protein
LSIAQELEKPKRVLILELCKERERKDKKKERIKKKVKMLKRNK